jgi:hypothetical protein
METAPKFIKDFSKEESVEERKQVAQSIRSVRQDYFTEVKLKEEKELEAKKIANEKERDLSEKLESINKLQDEIARLSESGLTKLLNYFELKKLQADLVVGQKTYEDLKYLRDLGSTGEKNDPEYSNKNELPVLLQKTKMMVDEFYNKQEKKWESSEYNKEDIEKYFSEDNLSSLSTEEYTLLLKRFPSEMVAHVTRQGIRDHIGLAYHTAGDGEYSNGFKNMVDDGRLRSPLGVYLIEAEKEKAVAKFLRLEEIEGKEEALEKLNVMTDPMRESSGSYTDRMAIHFATEEVADYYYGSEKGNEIFITYPSAYIASQYYFEGQLNQAGGGYWNDQWVWANEEKGISLNAGIVFIPEEASVDKENGSRYELDKEKNPIKNNEYVAAIRNLVNSNGFEEFANQAKEITGKLHSNISFDEMKSFELLKPLIQKLEKDFNIIDPRMQRAVLNYNNLSDLDIARTAEQLLPDELDSHYSTSSMIELILKNEGILFKETSNKVSSKEYWESYFKKNIKSKPAHIIYYKDESPTKALNKWKEENGLNKKSFDSNIGFSENRIVQVDAPQAIAGMDRFKILAEKVIDDYFLENSIKK